MPRVKGPHDPPHHWRQRSRNPPKPTSSTNHSAPPAGIGPRGMARSRAASCGPDGCPASSLTSSAPRPWPAWLAWPEAP